MKGEWRNLRKKLIKLGYRMHIGGKGHWKVYDANDRLITVLPCTASDHRALRNKISNLRQQGIAV